MTYRRLTDRQALELHRSRADGAWFLHELAIREVQERLIDVNRRFTKVALITGFPEIWEPIFAPDAHAKDTDLLALDEGAFDLVIHAMGLHWADDPVGQLVQCRRALRPDGVLMAVAFGGQTLSELRAVLAEAEAAEVGGLSPRIAPMGEVRDMGALLQRAGFSLPVADTLTQTVDYRDAMHLMYDLRAMGETNALADRHKSIPPRGFFARAAHIYAQNYGTTAGRVRATFELVFLTGWAPAENQPQPLRPGSANVRLADVLGTQEFTPNGEV